MHAVTNSVDFKKEKTFELSFNRSNMHVSANYIKFLSINSYLFFFYLATKAWASMWWTPTIGLLKSPAIFRAFRTPTAPQKEEKEKSM